MVENYEKIKITEKQINNHHNKCTVQYYIQIEKWHEWKLLTYWKITIKRIPTNQTFPDSPCNWFIIKQHLIIPFINIAWIWSVSTRMLANTAIILFFFLSNSSPSRKSRLGVCLYFSPVTIITMTMTMTTITITLTKINSSPSRSRD